MTLKAARLIAKEAGCNIWKVYNGRLRVNLTYGDEATARYV